MTAPALSIPPADPAAALEFLTARLTFQADVADVHASVAAGGFVLLDSRSRAAWDQGRVDGALHLPTPRSRPARPASSTRPSP